MIKDDKDWEAEVLRIQHDQLQRRRSSQRLLRTSSESASTDPGDESPKGDGQLSSPSDDNLQESTSLLEVAKGPTVDVCQVELPPKAPPPQRRGLACALVWIAVAVVLVLTLQLAKRFGRGPAPGEPPPPVEVYKPVSVAEKQVPVPRPAHTFADRVRGVRRYIAKHPKILGGVAAALVLPRILPAAQVQSEAGEEAAAPRPDLYHDFLRRF
eukprot:EG_transcript_24914